LRTRFRPVFIYRIDIYSCYDFHIELFQFKDQDQNRGQDLDLYRDLDLDQDSDLPQERDPDQDLDQLLFIK